MATYGTLKNTVLTYLDLVGSTDAGTVVEKALVETLKYIQARATVPKLIGKATATWGASTTSIPIGTTGSPKFNVTLTDFGSPNRLYVARDSNADAPGIPYTFREYLEFQDLKAVPSGELRDSLYDPASRDERPDRSWTIDSITDPADPKVIIYPASENNVLTLFYNKPPAAFVSGNSPEIDADWDHLLVEGAFKITDQWLKEPDRPKSPHILLREIDPQIEEFKRSKKSNRKRGQLRLSHRYSIYPVRR